VRARLLRQPKESCPEVESEQSFLAVTNTFVYNIIFNLGDFMSSRMFSSEQKAKLTQIINEGMAVMQEVEDLNAGLSDTIKAIAEEMEIKPAILKKAIKIAHKSKLGDENADNEELNTILQTVGKTL
jgi:transposase-like protein